MSEAEGLFDFFLQIGDGCSVRDRESGVALVTDDVVVVVVFVGYMVVRCEGTQFKSALAIMPDMDL
jgi:uncharacterized protein (DUF983 family)